MTAEVNSNDRFIHGPPTPVLTLFTEASLMGWGVVPEVQRVLGVRSTAHLDEHINPLEMKAVLLALNDLKTRVYN